MPLFLNQASLQCATEGLAPSTSFNKNDGGKNLKIYIYIHIYMHIQYMFIYLGDNNVSVGDEPLLRTTDSNTSG